MAAHVVEPAQLAVVAADDDDRLTGDIGAQEVAGRGDVGLPAGEHPLAGEDALALGLPRPLVDVGGAGQGRDECAGHRSPTAVGCPPRTVVLSGFAGDVGATIQRYCPAHHA